MPQPHSMSSASKRSMVGRASLPRSRPAHSAWPGFEVTALILDEPVAIDITVVAHPAERCFRIGQQRTREVQVARPAHVLAQRDQKQWCGVDAAVIGAMRYAVQFGKLAQAHFVQDLARL